MKTEVCKKNTSSSRVWTGIVFMVLLLLPLPAIILTRPQDLPLIGNFQCPIMHYFGYPCAGCGMTRAMIAFFHGDLNSAFHCNALFFLPLLIWLYLLIICSIKTMFNYTTSLKIPAIALPLIILLFIVYWLARIIG